uniref:hypothetical protein n=1 Tax=Pseudomonas chlororaphis TaxID=587753 RepID=UPI001C8329DE
KHLRKKSSMKINDKLSPGLASTGIDTILEAASLSRREYLLIRAATLGPVDKTDAVCLPLPLTEFSQGVTAGFLKIMVRDPSRVRLLPLGALLNEMIPSREQSAGGRQNYLSNTVCMYSCFV